MPNKEFRPTRPESRHNLIVDYADQFRYKYELTLPMNEEGDEIETYGYNSFAEAKEEAERHESYILTNYSKGVTWTKCDGKRSRMTHPKS